MYIHVIDVLTKEDLWSQSYHDGDVVHAMDDANEQIKRLE